MLSSDPTQAKRLFWRGGCAFNNEAVDVVQHEWELRDSAGASGALEDPVVRALMAKCIAES
jgi:hypothetical protein